jgi:hypothetical protein
MPENRIMGNTKLKESRPSKETNKENSGYPKFKEIDGSHPLKVAVPEAVVEYQVRTRHGGQVAFFNFELAIELGLIPENHPYELTKELKEEILQTFSIVIINEYDIYNFSILARREQLLETDEVFGMVRLVIREKLMMFLAVELELPN